MIGSLRGLVDQVQDGACVFDVNGVGYLVHCSRKTLDRLTARDGVQKLLVETRVSQDAITLFGFLDATERDAFLALIEVKTVGPQKALLVLSGLAPGDLARAIATKERKRLADVKGLGAATATRIVDEPAMQKWAVGRAMPEADGVGAGEPLPSAEPAGPQADAVSALVNLGWKRPEAAAAVARGARRLGDDAALAALITEALKEMAPR
ncbi:Holliday junction branch migration protein RuvA [Falsiroseomonas sp.]|uniref:Holliday junction branch migration protein RuvA n=1 Tax=Falsiroseomonas sp. TaxID=2870721 RepID=UPI0027184138|nr:Holliday junction branch migration protein RuvA [Falsiroseomonas sp.]MDO9499649.1 Holliday junction branch migration protein RuvA [Falsiroseomonas sp.]MDP3417519.1 Holliday junction branch migration protein RuvA [Falsiroseomonas sp.]